MLYAFDCTTIAITCWGVVDAESVEQLVQSTMTSPKPCELGHLASAGDSLVEFGAS